MQPAPINDQLSGFSSQQAAQLDDASLSTLRSLSSLCREFRQSTSATQRIQRGSPGAGQLGPVIRIHQSKFSTIAGQCQQIFTRYSRFPGVNLLQTRLNELQQTLGAGFDDTSTGYAQRVHVLERLNYENGTVRGVVDTIIEQHEYQWKNNKLPGQGDQQPVARRLAFSDSSQNQPATLSASNQPLGQIIPHKLPVVPSPRIKLPAASLLPTQQLGSDSESSTTSVPQLFKPPLPLPTTAMASGVQASISRTRPSLLGSSQLGLGSGGSLFPPMSSGTLALGPPPPLSRSHFQDSSGQQFGLNPSGTGLSALKTSSLFQSLPSTTSSTTVTHPSRVTPLPSVSSTGLGGLSIAITTVQAQTSGGLFGSQSAQNLISGIKVLQTGIGTSSSSRYQLSSQPAQAQAPAQTVGGLGTPQLFKQPGLSDLALGGGLGSGLGGQAGGLQLGSVGCGGPGGGLSSAGLGGLGGGLRLGQQGSSPFILGSRTTQAQSQRSFGPPTSAAGINFSAPVQAIPNQPSSSSTIVTPSQPSVSADLGTARATTNILYIPRQPMNRAGGSSNAGQESIPSNDENAEEQSSSQKQSFSLSVDQTIHVCNGITDLWDSKRHADVTFLVQGTCVTAHRIILASQSQYFDRLLFGEMREAREDEIQLSDVESVEAFQMLMQYAYSGCVDIQNGDIQDALDMLKLSDQFGFELLKDTLGEKLIVEINMENILHLLAYADLYQVTGLLDECCAFIDQHAGDVLHSDAILTVNDHVLKVILLRDSLCIEEIIILQTVVRWKKSNNMNKEEMKGVLDCVRLTEIPPRILFGEVEKSCLFEPESIMKALRVQNLSDFELMRPRGRKCTGINLMDDATIDISTSGTSASSSTDGVVFLNAPRQHISAGTCLSRFSPCESSVRVTLEQEYLVNTIELEDRPTRANWERCIPRGDIIGVHNIQKETFSYKIYVSRDGKDWKDLFDYSHHSCHSVQRLHFPPLVFRMFQFELTGSRCNSYLQLKFLKCSFEEDIKPFKFRERGIIAPLFPLKPKAYQTKGVRPETIVVNFSQPYSISMLSFRICGPINSVADITISNCLVAESAHLTEVKAHPFNEKLSVEFPEQTVTTITVEIRNVATSTNGPPVSVGTSMALPVSGEAGSSQLVDNKSQNSAQASASIPADSGVRGAGNQRHRRGNQVDELKYKIAGLTCQLLQPEE